MRRPRGRRELPEAGSRHIPTEMVQEILLKLPTRDVARSSCLSKQWRSVVKDPSFPKLHDTEHAVPSPGGGAEALLVTVNRVPGGSLQPSIYSVTSSKRMCRLLTESMGTSYVATNVCNSFICFGPAADGESPPVLCNPATGETLALPQAPPISFKEMDGYLFLLGFSRPTGEYKLFRLSFLEHVRDDSGHYVDVCTLGDSRGWRKNRYLVPFRPIYGVPPVLVDGKLYLLTGPWQFAGNPEGILVVDVASEAHCTYRLPREYEKLRGQALMDVFELHGRLCLAVNHVLISPERPKVEFWVISRLGRLDGKNNGRLKWELRYTFFVDVDHARRNAAASPYAWSRQYYKNRPRAAWVDEDDMLCYMLGDCLYKYNTNGYCRPDGFVPWHQKVQLPATSSPSNRRWNIYGGYRPSLLSPLAFALPSSQDDEDSEVHAIATLHTLRRHDSKRRPSNGSTSDGPGRKRICHGTNFQKR